MFHIIKSYLKFLWNSSNEHGVHSPFVFDLVTKCFYDKKPNREYLFLKHYREKLTQSTQTIQVTDFGAGSKVFKTNTRLVAQIAKTAGITPTNAELLYRITHYFQPKKTLEIGTSLGLATAALSAGNKNGTVTSLEGCANTQNIATEQLKKFGITNTNMVTTEFESFLKNENLQYECFNLIYFDGNHQKQATLNYFNLLLPTITNNSVWIFDDIHWSPEMESAWEEIKQNPQVTVTIDTFQCGFVFFRREQKKQHFTIRL